MSSSFSQLSASFARLSSLERRFIIIVIVILFVVINLLFVLPHFNDLTAIRNRSSQAETKLKNFDREIAQIPFYTKEVEKLGGEAAAVPPEEQSVNFVQTIQNQVVQSGIGPPAMNRQPERTNQFFIERAYALTTQSGEAQLVDFLYNLGAGNSLIRVRTMSIRPDAPRQALNATITLIASYQKKAAKHVASPAPGTTPAAKPAAKLAAPPATPVTKTNKPAAVPPAAKSSTPTKK